MTTIPSTCEVINLDEHRKQKDFAKARSNLQKYFDAKNFHINPNLPTFKIPVKAPLGMKAMIQINETIFPKIYAAFALVDMDNGIRPTEQYNVPMIWLDKLAAINTALAQLNSEEFELFCIGGRDDSDGLQERADMKEANDLLDEFFNDWEPQD